MKERFSVHIKSVTPLGRVLYDSLDEYVVGAIGSWSPFQVLLNELAAEGTLEKYSENITIEYLGDVDETKILSAS